MHRKVFFYDNDSHDRHKTCISKSCSYFETGWTSVPNFERSGHPSPSWTDDSMFTLYQVIQEENSMRLTKIVTF